MAPFLSNFLGSELNWGYYYPDLTSPYGGISGTVLVDNSTEGQNLPLGLLSFDISGNQIIANFLTDLSWDAASFNGFVLTDYLNEVAAIKSVSISAQSSFTSIDASDITVRADSIAVNWQGTSVTIGTRLVLDVAFDVGPALRNCEQIFAAEGKLAFLSQLALAAYHLDTTNGHEIEKTLVNDLNPKAEDAFNGSPVGPVQDGIRFTAVADHLQLLTARELKGLGLDKNWSTDPDDPDAIDDDFPKNGLRDGIYTNENAAALVGRSGDAIFLSFRGTNDARDADDGLWNILLATLPTRTIGPASMV